MQIGIFARTFAGNAPDIVFDQVAQAGYSAVHYNFSSSGLDPMPAKITSKQTSAILNAAAINDLNIVGVSGTFNMAHPEEDFRIHGLKRLGILGTFAHNTGIPLITLCTGTRDRSNQWKFHSDNGENDAWAALTNTMEQAIRVADDFDLQLGIEPERANVVNSAKQALRLLKQMQSSKLKIIFDPANLLETLSFSEQYSIIDQFLDMLADRIVMFHAKDLNADGQVVPAGEGVIDFSYCLKRLRAYGFIGPIITHGLTVESAGKVAHHLKELLGQC